MFFDKQEIKMFLTFFIIYIFFVRWGGWNENSVLDLTAAIVNENRFQIDTYHNNTSDRAYYEGSFYSVKAPGLSMLATPVYSIFKAAYYGLIPQDIFNHDEAATPRFIDGYAVNKEFIITTVGYNQTEIIEPIAPGVFALATMIVMTAMTSSLFSALTVVLVYKSSKLFSNNSFHCLMVALIYGLGTLALHYGLVFLTHATGTFVAFLAFYMILKFRNCTSSATYLAIGLLSGLAVLLEYETALIAGMIVFIVFFSERRTGLTMLFAGIIIGIMPLLAYNTINFWGPMTLASRFVDPKLFEITPFARFYLGFESPFPDLFIIMRMLIDPYRGLIFYSPVMIISFFGLYRMYKNGYRLEATSIASAFAILLLVFSTRTGTWYGGASFGMRYLLPIVPLLTMAMIFSMHKLKLEWILLLLVISMSVNFIGLQTPEDAFLDRETLSVSSRFLELQKSFQIIANPIGDWYIPLSFEYGPRSPIIEQLLMSKFPDIRDSMQINPEQIGPFMALSTSLLIKTSFLGMPVLLMALAALWATEISNTSVMGIPLAHIIAAVAIVFIFASFDFRVLGPDSVVYANFFQAEKNYYNVEFRWMSKKASVVFMKGIGGTDEFNFEAWSFGEKRKTDVSIDGTHTQTLDVTPDIGAFAIQIGNLPKGIHSIELSSNGCDFPKNDSRCLSVAVTNFVKSGSRLG